MGIERYIYENKPSVMPACDWHGFWRGCLKNGTAFYSVEEACQFSGGVLVGEGDCGKTWYLNALLQHVNKFGRAKLFSLRDYSEYEAGALENDVEAFLNERWSGDECGEQCLVRYVLIDGLDEQPKLAQVVGRIFNCHANDLTVRIWLSTRPCFVEEEFVKYHANAGVYKLAPFRKVDVSCMAEEAGADAFQFVKAISDAEIIDICSRPGGCRLSIRLFQSGALKDTTPSTALYRIAIELCKSRREGVSTEGYGFGLDNDLDASLDCAAWMASVILLLGKRAIYTKSDSFCPDDCVPTSKFVTPLYSNGQVASVLHSQLFEPFGEGLMRFSYARVPSFLAARWLCEHLSKENAHSILVKDNLQNLTREVEDVLAWVSILKPNFACVDVYRDRYPELMLCSKEIFVNSSSKSEIYDLLEDRYARSTSDDRELYFGRRLRALECAEIETIVREKLCCNDSSETALAFALDVAKYCGYDIVDELVNIVTSDHIDVNVRRTLSYDLRDQDLEEGNVQQLRTVIKHVPKCESEETVLGNVLMCLWPSHMSVEELLFCLRSPVKKNLYAAYQHFCRDYLPQTLEQDILIDTAAKFIDWAEQFVAKDGAFDYISDLAREIFTLAWKFADDDRVCDGLAKCIIATGGRSSGCLGLPFVSNENFHHKYIRRIDEKCFYGERNKRLKVLARVIDILQCRYELYRVAGLWLDVNGDLRLVVEDDFDAIANMACESNYVVSEGLRSVLEYFVVRVDIEQHLDALNRLSIRWPDNRKFKVECIEEYKREGREYLKKVELEREKSTEDNSRLLSENKRQILNFLDNDNLEWDKFFPLLEFISGDKWVRGFPSAHPEQFGCWKELTDTQRRSVGRLAKSFLQHVGLPLNKNEAIGVYVTAASLLVCRHDSKWVNVCTDEQWSNALRHIFHCSFEYLDDAQVKSFIEALLTKKPRCVANALFDAISDYCERDFPNPIRFVKQWLDSELIDRLLSCFKSVRHNGKKLYEILVLLCDTEYKEKIKCFIGQIIDPVSKTIPIEDSELLLLALDLDGERYSRLLQSLIAINPELADRWLRRVVRNTDLNLVKILLSFDSNIISEFYYWLAITHPAKDAPEHDEAFNVQEIDEVYLFKSEFLSAIVKAGRQGWLDMLKALAVRLPDEPYWSNCISQCENVVRDGMMACALTTLDDLVGFASQRLQISQRVYHSSIELMDVILNALKDLEDVFQTEYKVVRVLWSEVPVRLWCRRECDVRKRRACGKRDSESIVFPRDESFLSDAIAVYLKTKLPKLVAFREPQVTRKCYCGAGSKDGFSDIIIEDTLDSGAHLKVIIEIKCNFNKEIKNALNEQLIKRYIEQTPDSSGILLCGCYDSPAWLDCDPRKRSIVKGYRNVDEAGRSMMKQWNSAGKRNNVKVIAIDCSLT